MVSIIFLYILNEASLHIKSKIFNPKLYMPVSIIDQC